MRVGCLESAGTLKGGIGKSSSSWTVSTSAHGSQTCPMIDDLAPGREVAGSGRSHVIVAPLIRKHHWRRRVPGGSSCMKQVHGGCERQVARPSTVASLTFPARAWPDSVRQRPSVRRIWPLASEITGGGIPTVRHRCVQCPSRVRGGRPASGGCSVGSYFHPGAPQE